MLEASQQSQQPQQQNTCTGPELQTGVVLGQAEPRIVCRKTGAIRRLKPIDGDGKNLTCKVNCPLIK